MHGNAGGVLVVVVVVVVRVILGGGRRPRSKLKTGWTGSAAAWTAPAGQMAQALCGSNTGLSACHASCCFGGSQAAGSGSLVADVRPSHHWTAGPVSSAQPFSSVSINLDLGSQICKMSGIRFCFLRRGFLHAGYKTHTINKTHTCTQDPRCYLHIGGLLSGDY